MTGFDLRLDFDFGLDLALDFFLDFAMSPPDGRSARPCVPVLSLWYAGTGARTSVSPAT